MTPHPTPLAGLLPGIVVVLTAFGAGTAHAQYGSAYHKPDTMRLQQMATQRANAALNAHYAAISRAPMRTPTLRLDSGNSTVDSPRVETRPTQRNSTTSRQDVPRTEAPKTYTGSTRSRCGEGCSETLQVAGGGSYQGQTEGGVPQGPGTLRLASGELFTGTWQSGRLTAPVKVVYPNGDVYEGGFDGSRLSGSGRVTYASLPGAYDIGTFSEGRLDGEVERVQVQDGVRFVTRGRFKAGLPTGQHETIVTGGNKLKRTVENFDKPSESIAEWHDGKRFVGYMKDGVPVEGTVTFANGNKFTGLFHPGGAPRAGLFTSTKGGTQYGFYNERSKRQGYVAMSYPDGSSAEIMHDNDQWAGPVLRTLPNGDVLTGTTAKPGYLVFGMLVPAGADSSAARPAGITDDGRNVSLPDVEQAAARQAAIDAAQVISTERAKLKQLLEQ